MAAGPVDIQGGDTGTVGAAQESLKPEILTPAVWRSGPNGRY